MPTETVLVLERDVSALVMIAAVRVPIVLVIPHLVVVVDVHSH